MKNFVNRMVISLVVCALVCAVALAGDRTEQVTLPQDMMVNGTLVRRGTYKMNFNEQTGELTLSRGSNVVARATARVENRETSARRTEIGTARNGDSSSLRRITFRGETRSIVLSDGDANAQARP